MGGMIAQVIAQDEPQLVRKLILAGTGPAGGEGITSVTRLSHLDTVRAVLTLQDPKQFLFFTRTSNGRRAGKEFLARLKERTETATRRSRSGPTSRSSRRSTAGAWTRPPTCRSSASPCSSPTATATGWCPPATPSTWPGGCPTAELVIYPDAGHGGIFQFHEQFVPTVLDFLGQSSRREARSTVSANSRRVNSAHHREYR